MLTTADNLVKQNGSATIRDRWRSEIQPTRHPQKTTQKQPLRCQRYGALSTAESASDTAVESVLWGSRAYYGQCLHGAVALSRRDPRRGAEGHRAPPAPSAPGVARRRTARDRNRRDVHGSRRYPAIEAHDFGPGIHPRGNPPTRGSSGEATSSLSPTPSPPTARVPQRAARADADRTRGPRPSAARLPPPCETIAASAGVDVRPTLATLQREPRPRHGTPRSPGACRTHRRGSDRIAHRTGSDRSPRREAYRAGATTRRRRRRRGLRASRP
jgi:hypothetical protein